MLFLRLFIIIFLFLSSTSFSFDPSKCLQWGMDLSEVQNTTEGDFTLVNLIGSLNTYFSPATDNFYLRVDSLESANETFIFTDCDKNFIGLTVMFQHLSPDQIRHFEQILVFKYGKKSTEYGRAFAINDPKDGSTITLSINSDSTTAIINYKTKELKNIEKDYDSNPLKMNDL